MWIIIKRKSDYNPTQPKTIEPLCIQVSHDEVDNEIEKIQQCCKDNTLYKVTPVLWISPRDILSLQVYDEDKYIGVEMANAKPPKRRLNEG